MKTIEGIKFFCILLCIGYVLPALSQDYPSYPEIIVADSLLEAGQYEDAISAYEKIFNSKNIIKSTDKTAFADVAMNTGLGYYNLDEYEKAIEWFQKAAELYKETGDLESLASMMNNIGMNYKILGNYEKAIEYYEATALIDEELGSKGDIAITYNNMGMIYRAWGKYDRAIEYLEKSYLLKKESKDISGMSTTLNNIGLVYSEWKKYDEAIAVFRESLEIEISLKNETEISRRINNIGRVFFYKQNFDSARYYFEKSLPISQKNNDMDMIALISNNLGKVYLERKEYARATEYFTSALKIFHDLGMISEKSTVMANLGKCNWAQGKYKEALQMLDSSTAMAEKLHNASQMKQNYMYLSDMFSDSKDFEKSLFYYKKYTALKDTIFTKEIMGQLSEFQVKYEKEKDKAQILRLEQENLRKTFQRNAYMYTGLALVIMAAFIIVFFRQRARHIKIISEQRIHQLEEEKKLIAAKLLVEGQEEERKRIATELHDGLGVLLSATKMQFSVIKDKSPENRELIDKATHMLEQASGDVRKISHNMMPGLLTKLGFFDAVEDLFEHIGDTEELNTNCSILGLKERFAENKEIMLYRIVQEMVNNSLKYAHAKNINLKIVIDNTMLDLIYTDDGVGFDKTALPDSESIGLKSIESRVNFLTGKMKLDSSTGHGVKYSIQVPI